MRRVVLLIAIFGLVLPTTANSQSTQASFHRTVTPGPIYEISGNYTLPTDTAFPRFAIDEGIYKAVFACDDPDGFILTDVITALPGTIHVGTSAFRVHTGRPDASVIVVLCIGSWKF